MFQVDAFNAGLIYTRDPDVPISVLADALRLTATGAIDMRNADYKIVHGHFKI